MPRDEIPTDMARVLAELLDAALADHWTEDEPTMALLWQSPDDPDDLRIAVKHLDGPIDDELTPLADLGPYRAVAHSTVTRQPIPELLPTSDGLPVRITVAVDLHAEAGVVRHRNGSTQWFSAMDLPVIRLVRSVLRLEREAA
jgi:hypothetical protein